MMIRAVSSQMSKSNEVTKTLWLTVTSDLKPCPHTSIELAVYGEPFVQLSSVQVPLPPVHQTESAGGGADGG